MPPAQHILRRRQPPDPKAPWGDVITEADREEARRLSAQARSEGQGARRAATAEMAPPVAKEPVSQPINIPVTRPRVEDSPKFEKFRELIETRMPKALTEIENIKFLASKERYDYAEEHAAKVVAALREAVEEVATAFSEEGKRKPRKSFSLDC